MVAHSAGETFEGVTDARGRPASEADRSGGARYQLAKAWPPIGPGSLVARDRARCARRTACRPAAAFAGWAPARLHLNRAAEGDHPQRRPRGLDRASEPLGRRLRLRDRPPRRVRSRGITARPISPTRSPPRARSPASTTRSRSPDAVTSTAASTRPRTSTSSATRTSTSSSASTRPRRCTRRAPGTRSSGSGADANTPPAAGSAARRRSCAPTAPR